MWTERISTRLLGGNYYETHFLTVRWMLSTLNQPNGTTGRLLLWWNYKQT
jgi:hypothetical protein